MSLMAARYQLPSEREVVHGRLEEWGGRLERVGRWYTVLKLIRTPLRPEQALEPWGPCRRGGHVGQSADEVCFWRRRESSAVAVGYKS